MMTRYPSSASCLVKRCARSTSEHVASMHSRPCSSMLLRIAGGTPCARMTTIPDPASAGSLITFTPRAASRSLIFGLCTTWPRLKTGLPDSAAASVSSTAFLTPKQNPFSRARRTSTTPSVGALSRLLSLGRIDAAHVRRQELRDLSHDRVGDLLLARIRIQPQGVQLERL